MARANTYTWLGLDRWAEIIGINPLFWNSLYLTDDPPTGQECSSLWQQFSYTDPNNLGREDIARAIANAESQIANWLGFNLLPDWICNEELVSHRAKVPEAYPTMVNVRDAPVSVSTFKKRVIAGGVRGVIELALSTPIKFEDLDSDGYDETGSIRFSCPWTEEPEPCDPLPLVWDLCEYRIFYANHGGDPLWEIKPTKYTLSGGNIIIWFNSWQVVSEVYTRGGFVKHELDANDPASYETHLDVYRVYNDTRDQATLIWNDCGACGGGGCALCSDSRQTACVNVRNSRLGHITYNPATYSDETGLWTSEGCLSGRAPDRILVNYYSGLQAQCDCPAYKMPDYLECAIAYFACALLDRDVCCEDCDPYINKWRVDLAASGEGITSYQNGAMVLNNPFGTKLGAVEAWRLINTDQRLKVSN